MRNDATTAKELFFKISLAQWSLHRSIQKGFVKPEDFADIAMNDYGIDGIEYVNQFYMDHGNDESYFIQLAKRASDVGVTSLLMMVDDEGELGDSNDMKRKTSAENHHKWVDAAKILGCHSIRVNAFGEGTKEGVKSALVDGLGQLGAYAGQEGINVLLENHGLYSSDALWMVDVVEQLGMKNVGLLPDFGNFCLSAKWGSTQIECDEVYDRYKGVKEMLPYAFAVSAKSYNFDQNGNDTTIDYRRMLQVVKEAGYTGYVGIEYEGTERNEREGILATKTLLERIGREV